MGTALGDAHALVVLFHQCIEGRRTALYGIEAYRICQLREVVLCRHHHLGNGKRAGVGSEWCTLRKQLLSYAFPCASVGMECFLAVGWCYRQVDYQGFWIKAKVDEQCQSAAPCAGGSEPARQVWLFQQ